MDAKQKNELNFRYTRPLGSFGAGESTDKLLKMFWECPNSAVRDECLSALTRQQVDENNASWIEERIPVICNNASIFERNYFEQLLSWYLFNIPDGQRELRVRAVAFVVSLFLNDGVSYNLRVLPLLSKMITGAVHEHPELYWAPSVPEFLEASLAHENWTIVERALYLICRAEDTSFLPRVIELSRKAGEEKEKKEDFETKASDERFASAKARGILNEAVRHLLICKTEEAESDTKVFEAAFTKAIGERAGQDPPKMWISLNYGKSGSLESIEMHLYPITPEARDFLDKCEILISALGIEIISGAERELLDPEGHGQYRFPQYRARFSFSRDLCAANCRLQVNQVRKTARLGIFVNLLDQGMHQLGHWVHYHHRDGE